MGEAVETGITEGLPLEEADPIIGADDDTDPPPTDDDTVSSEQKQEFINILFLNLQKKRIWTQKNKKYRGLQSECVRRVFERILRKG